MNTAQLEDAVELALDSLWDLIVVEPVEEIDEPFAGGDEPVEPFEGRKTGRYHIGQLDALLLAANPHRHDTIPAPSRV